jgi:Arc/MetJ-type ribon-helix-helix transcriptional regulator
MMNIALTDELQRLHRKKVENGQFPNEEAVVREALTRFLIEEPLQGRPQTSSATEVPSERLPGPFIEDETALAPVELPRPGQEITCSYLYDAMRQPTLSHGE